MRYFGRESAYRAESYVAKLFYLHFCRAKTALWWFIVAEHAAQPLPSPVVVPPVATVPRPSSPA